MNKLSNEDRTKEKHIKFIYGYKTLDDEITWHYRPINISLDEDERIEVRFYLLVRNNPSPQKNYVLRKISKYFEKVNFNWLVPGIKVWGFNLDAMKDVFPDLNELVWCKGKVFLEPEFEIIKEETDINRERFYHTSLVFYISPKVIPMQAANYLPPIEIQQSLHRFRLDYPDASKVAFIMMKFGVTKAHTQIVKGISDALSSHGIVAVRADDKQYHDDLYYNIMTYLYGCGFGIAVFERIERDDFNPNVSLEVGYSLALGKEVCLLKDKTLPTLHTDLVGKLYRTFDPQDPISSISPELTKWMKDKGII
jgi:hypothetical protein